MKILLLASRLPYPLDNGEDLRVFHFVKHLSKVHELHFLGYESGSLPAPEAERYFKNIHLVRRKSPNGQCASFASKLLRTFSPDQMYFFDPEIKSRLERLLVEDKFELVWIPAWQMFPYALTIGDVRAFIDVMDDGVLELARELRHSRSPRAAALCLKRLFVTYFFERKYFRDVALCSLVSEKDAQVLRRVCPGAKLAVIPNGVDSDYFSPLGLGEDFPSIILEGNMSFAPTVDAVLYFVHEIFPRIQKQVPQVKFSIVGKEPSREVIALDGGQIVVTGYVADVRPFLDKASVFVCPMRKGAGIKNKILQAWAMAKPVVATSIALGGLRAEDGKNIIVANGADSLARAVIRLLASQALRERIGSESRNTVLAHYTWEQQVSLVDKALRDA